MFYNLGPGEAFKNNYHIYLFISLYTHCADLSETIPLIANRICSNQDRTDVWPRGYKTFFMLNSTEHEISTAHKN